MPLQDGTVEALVARAQALAGRRELIDGVSRAARHSAGVQAVDGAEVVTAIDGNDQMFLHSLLEHRDPGAALAQYYSIGIQQYALLSQLLKALKAPDRPVRVLDFACGHGRALRFARLSGDAVDLCASEIQADALDFIRTRLGIPVLQSAVHPDDFACGGGFDLIWVASLFSHLPAGLFEPWLAKLLSLLSPGGILCFSTKPMAGGEGDGFEYVGTSEVTPLGPEVYGTTHVTGDYVGRMVERVEGGFGLVRLNKCLAHEQDLYLAARTGAVDLQSIANGLASGAWGWLDIRRRDAAGRLVLEGWAASFDEAAPLERVRVTVDGHDAIVAVDIPRPDVAEAFGLGAQRPYGWRFTSSEAVPEGALVTVTAETATYTHLVYIGEL